MQYAPALFRAESSRHVVLLLVLLLSEAASAAAIGRIAAESGVDPAGAATWSVPISVSAGRGGLRRISRCSLASHQSASVRAGQ